MEVNIAHVSGTLVIMNSSRTMRWSKLAPLVAEIKVVGECEGKRQFGRSKCRWEDVIKMCLREISWGGGDVWTGFTWLRTGTGGGLS
jgi:hypothetical protein